MTEIAASRRNLLRLAGGALAASAALSASDALAYQGNMERALSSLYGSLASLRKPPPTRAATRRRLPS